MAEANGTVAVRDPDALVTEIERTRESLARTVDQLADRVSPANVARPRPGPGPGAAPSGPEARIAGGALAAWPCWRLGVAVYLIRRRHR